ncbi:MAG: N-acetyl-gamma-glutamyl-phosphate reductase [Proteobacteria bacterium]|nr:MAG: N-acetyl-gamma-glutamyl-phosphate reductase [Pseudomonadota bacterium]
MSSSAESIRVGIAGVRGYKGTETARLIARHPRFRIAMVASDVMAGGRLRDLDPELSRDGDALCFGYNDTVSAGADEGVQLMFLATRPSKCDKLAAAFVSHGVRVVDLSGAHSIRDHDDHVEAYGFVRQETASAEGAVYGLTELADREAIAGASLVANPTSYATAVLLALTPLAEAGILDPTSVVVDVKSSSSASGRKAQIPLLFSELAGNCYATKIDRHPHTPEVLEQLAPVAGPDLRLTMASHIMPVTRGMLSTCYLRVPGVAETRAATEQVRLVLRARYASAPFVTVLDRAEDVTLRAARGTNQCLIGAATDPYGDRVVLVSAIDNLLKGAAGQAMQNANLMFGLDEATAIGRQ